MDDGRSPGRSGWRQSTDHFVLTESLAAPVPNFTALPSTANVASTIHWDAVPGAASYRVQINNLSTKSVRSIDVVSTNELSVTITQPGRYTIWLDTGFTSEWSAGTAFDVAAQPLVMS